LQVEFDVDEQQGRKASSTWCDLHVTWASWVCKFRQNQSDLDRGRPAIRWSENKVTRGWHPLYFLDDGSRLRNRLSIWPCRMKVVLPVSAFVCALSADGQGMPPPGMGLPPPPIEHPLAASAAAPTGGGPPVIGAPPPPPPPVAVSHSAADSAVVADAVAQIAHTIYSKLAGASCRRSRSN
jgi:hypothetical protein